MTRRVPVITLVFMTTGLFFGLEALEAQESLSLTVNHDGKPAAGVEVAMLVNGIKQPLGETDQDGNAVIDFNLVNLIKGTPVETYAVTCNGETQVLMTAPGESIEEECERARRENPDCTCSRRLGTLIWWETGAATIDIGPKGISMETMDGASRGALLPRITLGLKVDAVVWPRLDDIACEIGDGPCDADTGSVGYGGFIESQLGATPLSVGGGVFYTRTTIDKDLEGAGSAEIDLNAWNVDFYGQGKWPISPSVGFFALIGGAWIRNSASFDTDEGTIEKRSESGVRLNLGGGVDLFLHDTIGIRINYNYVSGGGDDADTSHRLGGGLLFTP